MNIPWRLLFKHTHRSLMRSANQRGALTSLTLQHMQKTYTKTHGYCSMLVVASEIVYALESSRLKGLGSDVVATGTTIKMEVKERGGRKK